MAELPEQLVVGVVSAIAASTTSVVVRQNTAAGPPIWLLTFVLVVVFVFWVLNSRYIGGGTGTSERSGRSPSDRRRKWRDDVMESLLDENFADYEGGQIEAEEFSEMYPEKKQRIEKIRERRREGT